MRLIDKDVFLERMKKWEYEEYMWDALDETPEVEAIPISWIKTYALTSGEAVLPFIHCIDKWREKNGQQ